MPFCTQCGAKLEENAMFCTSCGAKQTKISYPASGTENGGYPNEEPKTPTYGGYTQSSYDPTVYSAQTAGAYAPQGGKKKGSGGKVVLIILAALLALGLIIFAATKLMPSRGPDVDESVLGLYSATKAQMYGIQVDVSTIWEDGFDIELKKNGKCSVNVDGTKGNANWTLDGSDFTLKARGLELNGTLRDGVIRIDNAMDMGVTLYFTKDGVDLPSTSLPVMSEPETTPEPEKEPAETEQAETEPTDTEDETTPEPETSAEPQIGNDASILGTYYADKCEYVGIVIEIADKWEDGFSLELLEGGECNVVVNGIEGTGSWKLDGDKITVDADNIAMEMSGTVSDGVIKLENAGIEGMTLYFTKDSSMKPEEKPVAEGEKYSWWNGSYYGWWTAYDGGGDFANYPGNAWDACAIISVNDDGTGSIIVWDEDNDNVMQADVSFTGGSTDNGCMVCEEGKFYNSTLGHADWTSDPGDGMFSAYDHVIVINGVYKDPSNEENWIEYYIFLRPWGMRWDDVANGDMSGMIYSDMMPLQYETWYLPKIEAGEDMPLGFDE